VTLATDLNLLKKGRAKVLIRIATRRQNLLDKRLKDRLLLN
jgi:hypothetical protein